MTDKKGARGFGFGELDKEAREFLRAKFDRERQRGEIYVGYYNQATDNAQVEGDDVE